MSPAKLGTFAELLKITRKPIARMRHVKIRSLDDAEAPAVRRLIKAAVTERRKALGC